MGGRGHDDTAREGDLSYLALLGHPVATPKAFAELLPTVSSVSAKLDIRRVHVNQREMFAYDHTVVMSPNFDDDMVTVEEETRTMYREDIWVEEVPRPAFHA